MIRHELKVASRLKPAESSVAEAIWSSRLKVRLYLYFTTIMLILNICFDHFFCYWSYCCTKMSSSPQVLTSVSLSQLRILILYSKRDDYERYAHSAIMGNVKMEGWPSGRRRLTWNQLEWKLSGVRILCPPPISDHSKYKIVWESKVNPADKRCLLFIAFNKGQREYTYIKP